MLLASLAIVAVSARFAFFDLFSIFRSHDDEGFMLMFVRLFLEGHVIYDEVGSAYGPFYLMFKWLTHANASLITQRSTSDMNP